MAECFRACPLLCQQQHETTPNNLIEFEMHTIPLGYGKRHHIILRYIYQRDCIGKIFVEGFFVFNIFVVSMIETQK